MPKHVQRFENLTEEDLVVDVEANPDRYILRPKEVLELTYEHNGDGCGLHTNVFSGWLQIYLEKWDTAVVTIDGVLVRPWSHPKCFEVD